MTLFFIGLLLLFGMNFITNTFIPMPITPATLWMGQFHHPILVILASTAGTVLGWIAFYKQIYTHMERYEHLLKKIPKSYFHFFQRGTFLWIFAINALPFPLDFIRLIAVANKQSAASIGWAIGTGRLIRNTLLVYVGAWLFQYQQWFIATLVILFVIPLVASGMTFMRQRFKPSKSSAQLDKAFSMNPEPAYSSAYPDDEMDLLPIAEATASTPAA